MLKKRQYFVGIFLGLLAIVAFVRLFHLHVSHRDFYHTQGKARFERHVTFAAPRGNIVDRHGAPLAITVPIQTLYINPQQFQFNQTGSAIALTILGLDAKRLKARIAKNPKSQFLYLRRQVSPSIAQKVLDLKLKGLYELTEYKRFYPDAEAVGPLLGVCECGWQGDCWVRVAV